MQSFQVRAWEGVEEEWRRGDDVPFIPLHGHSAVEPEYVRDQSVVLQDHEPRRRRLRRWDPHAEDRMCVARWDEVLETESDQLTIPQEETKCGEDGRVVTQPSELVRRLDRRRHEEVKSSGEYMAWQWVRSTLLSANLAAELPQQCDHIRVLLREGEPFGLVAFLGGLEAALRRQPKAVHPCLLEKMSQRRPRHWECILSALSQGALEQLEGSVILRIPPGGDVIILLQIREGGQATQEAPIDHFLLPS